MSEAATVCMANIGPRERRKRLAIGVVGMALGLGATVALIALRLPWAWRLLTVAPFFVGTSGYFQAREKT